SRIVDVRLNRATIAGFNIGYAVPDSDHFDPQLVAENSRVRHERHLAEVGADIRPANANAMNSHQRFTRAGRWRLGKLRLSKCFWRFELKSVHRKRNTNQRLSTLNPIHFLLVQTSAD